jgi:hypothetical protein
MKKEFYEDLEEFVQKRISKLTYDLCEIEEKAYIDGYLQGRKDRAEEIFAKLDDLFRDTP